MQNKDIVGIRDFDRSVSFRYLESEQLKKYKYAFNPSFIEYKEKKLLSFRCNDHNNPVPDYTRFAFLDNNFNIIEDSIFNPNKENVNFKSEDSRLFLMKDQLIMIYGDNGKMFIAYINDDFQIFKIKHLKIQGQTRHEKNWNPFMFDGEIHFVYKPGPIHQIAKIIKEDYSNILLKNVYMSKGISGIANFGNEAKSNTPPVKIDNSYYSFFHTSRWENQKNHENNNIVKVLSYYTWFYEFNAFPPFQVKKISSSPVMSGDKRFFNNIWNKYVCVNFPVGSLYNAEKKMWLLFSGEYDKRMSISEFFHDDLLK